MYSLKKSLIALVGLLLLVGVLAAVIPLVGRGQGQGQPPFAQRRFYLTQTEHDGLHALSACANGYHMASLWEIFDTSNLRYDTQLGVTHADSGFGPPIREGWIRSGLGANDNAFDGANCNAWTTDSSNAFGTIVGLSPNFSSSNVTISSPWLSDVIRCNQNESVWCVQD